VRFTASDLKALTLGAAEAEAAFKALDEAFKGLSASAKKKALPPAMVEAPSQQQQQQQQKRAPGAAALGGKGGGLDDQPLGDSYVAPPAAAVLSAQAAAESGGEDAVASEAGQTDVEPAVAEAAAWHELADTYMGRYRALVVGVVRRKQAEIPDGEKEGKRASGFTGFGELRGSHPAPRLVLSHFCAPFRVPPCTLPCVGIVLCRFPGVGSEVVVDKDHGEGLSAAKALPDYLASLLAKYLAATAPQPSTPFSAEASAAETCAVESGASKSGALVDSLGRLATFVGCCLFGGLPLTDAELDALEVNERGRKGSFSRQLSPRRLEMRWGWWGVGG
jgi:hypothetical protein